GRGAGACIDWGAGANTGASCTSASMLRLKSSTAWRITTTATTVCSSPNRHRAVNTAPTMRQNGVPDSSSRRGMWRTSVLRNRTSLKSTGSSCTVAALLLRAAQGGQNLQQSWQAPLPALNVRHRDPLACACCGGGRIRQGWKWNLSCGRSSRRCPQKRACTRKAFATKVAPTVWISRCGRDDGPAPWPHAAPSARQQAPRPVQQHQRQALGGRKQGVVAGAEDLGEVARGLQVHG